MSQLKELEMTDLAPTRQVVSDIKHKDAALQVDKLTVGYKDDAPILTNVSYTFSKRGCYLITGDNASGKSTLMKTIVGLVRPLSGYVYQKENTECCYVPQTPYLFPGTIFDNLVLGIGKFDIDQVNHLVEITNLSKDLQAEGKNLNNVIDNRSISLSTGQIQKVKLIRGIIASPQVLIIDEVLSNIDVESNKNILSYLRGWSKTHTLIIVAHDNERIKASLCPVIIDVNEL
ncbi:ABC-type multidrug protein lipid transport system, ATPase component [Lacticaseibacillus manihotivorans DSM 13343 = JCM 12514]|uniref:ABC-type multidrug protein lipid transport system, ATPase component n=1 Tax=Lacticaseibacillus manihotivorans DSM 13343 = JCM 12514 TaxID=1423769 RepID=A0A0R1R906_9LACO|nr:ABC-type multidrug protein lipid transport system, ATPase component [Lacticaseibacillus manihotivorans DSM 13343 = JCM 12514]